MQTRKAVSVLPEPVGAAISASCPSRIAGQPCRCGSVGSPIVLAGKGGGSLKTGRILDYLAAGDDNRKVCSLHLSLMDRMGVKLDRFGDASTRLAGL